MDQLEECVKVMSVNIVAFMVSWSTVEEFFRIAGLIAAFVYTCLKIYELIKQLNSKR